MDLDQAAGLISTLTLLRDLGAYGGLGLIVWLFLTGRIVTRGHLDDVVAGKNQEIADAKGREAEWKRVALRSTEDILPPLATAVRARVQEQLHELRGASEPGS